MNQERIGRFIAERRKIRKFTQEELAEKLMVSKNAVSKWERGLNLPDVSIMQDLCKILDITLNELFSGEKIPEDKVKEMADQNLFQVMENSVFTLKDRIAFFKEKWEKEHFIELTLVMLIIIFFILYGFIKDNGVQYLFMFIGFIYGIFENNRMMAYIENHAYTHESNITARELKDSIKKIKEVKEILSQFENKKEAIDFLHKETGLSKKECLEAYHFILKLDLDKLS